MKIAFISWVITFFFVGHPMIEAQELVGIWNGVDQYGNKVMIAFEQNGNYNLKVNGISLTNNIEPYGQIKYRVKRQDDIYQIELYGALNKQTIEQLKAQFKEEQSILELTSINTEGNLGKISLLRQNKN